ncbi:MAG TPA: hypothetical protein VLJ58_18430 [Ramlibacter sp.]|nr:hypothetical protein [Ramlibacter sp.]
MDEFHPPNLSMFSRSSVGLNALRHACVAALGLFLAAQAVAQQRAEYALRWDPVHGGPQHLDEVFKSLGAEPKKSQEAYPQVLYFGVEAPLPKNVPAGTRIIVRQRGSAAEAQTMWKYRSDLPFKEPSALTCPLRSAAKSKYEQDVSVTESGAARVSYASSCTGDGTVKDQVQAATALKVRGCPSKMVRKEAKGTKLTVEQWTLANGKTVIEVSFTGDSGDMATAEFHTKVVKRLLAAGARPLEQTMTELGTSC